MKMTKLLQIADLLIQGLLLLNVLISAGAAVVDDSFLLWAAFGLLPLGLWQLFSALVLGIWLKDPIRCLYMITAVAFCSLPVAGSFLAEWFPQRIFSYEMYELETPFFTIMLTISFVAGMLYFYYSLTAYEAVKKQTLL